ncbi:MAG: preprotein translocase subunit SecG [Bacteroidia bacterium]|nr:preprotein translocase subunit SecG [Bacteroidia bacterium]
MILSIVLISVCALLMVSILLQNSKGSGIQSRFSEAYQLIGVKRTSSLMVKASWTLALALVVLTVIVSH